VQGYEEATLQARKGAEHLLLPCAAGFWGLENYLIFIKMFLINLIKNISWFLIFLFIFTFFISIIGSLVGVFFLKLYLLLLLLIFLVSLLQKEYNFLDKIFIIIGIISILFLIFSLF